METNHNRRKLSKYASSNTSTILNNRIFQHNEDLRLEFQRDRDRIIHSRAFRRLQGKTQVFSPEKGDHYRNRLTHTLEVSQIGRTIGRVLELNEDLIEAISLGHDLGHTPFGHSGEKILHEIVTGRNADQKLKFDLQGGFKHNFQSLHIVDNLEMSARGELGLNLTFAVREGIIKHTGNMMRIDDGKAKVRVDYEDLNLVDMYMNLNFSITLEGQAVALADEIAQSTHDLEDGFRSGIINVEVLMNNLKNKVKELQGEIDGKEDIEEANEKLFKELRYQLGLFIEINKDDTMKARNKLIRKLIDLFIKDGVKYSEGKMEKYKPSKFDKDDNGDKTYIFQKLIIENSAYFKEVRKFINEYIHEAVISSQEIAQSDSKSKYLIRQIFKAYYEEPRQLPDYILERYFRKKGEKLIRKNVYNNKKEIQKDLAFIRLICDHIGGMTDKYALSEYNKLYGTRYESL